MNMLRLEKVTTASKENITAMINMFQSSMDTFNSKLNVATSAGGSTSTMSLDGLQQEFRAFQLEISQLLLQLNSIVIEMTSRMDDQECYSRRNCVLLHGVLESANENTEEVITKVIEETGILDFKLDMNSMVDRCHRLGKVKNEAEKSKPRPIIINFISYRFKNMIWVNKKRLKGSAYAITESLTHKRMALLRMTKDALGNKNTWTSDGRILSLLPNGKKVLIKNEEDLRVTVETLSELPALTIPLGRTRFGSVSSAAKIKQALSVKKGK